MIIPDNVGSKYRFIVLVGQRVAQLQKGAKPKIEADKKMKFTEIATREIQEGVVKFGPKKAGDDEEAPPKGKSGDLVAQ